MYSRIILLIFLPIFGFSQAPQKINFQSILRNTKGEVVANKSVSLKISILSGSISSSSVYSETHTKTTDISGLISLQIGNGTVLSGVFANIAWGDFTHFIKLEADFSGGSTFVLLGTQELMSVPYALYASKTDTSSLNLTSRFSTKLKGSDTISLSNRINAKSSLSDTSLLNLTNRFSTKLNETDTLSLSNRIDAKLNLSDTSNMLFDYRTSLNNKVSISDTASMLNPYLRKSDSIIADLQLQNKQLQNLSNIVDIDGNSYKTVKIGSQVWMSENLKTSHYRNGDPIPIVTDNVAWSGLITGALCWYDNDSTTFENPYGNLYNWFAVSDSRGICPIGWNLPTDAEWTTLTDYLGGESVAGGKMKSIGTSYWNYPNIGATNESGFSVLPGGFRYNYGSFYDISNSAFFWSATEFGNTNAWIRTLNIYVGNVNRDSNAISTYNKSVGASVRCLKNADIDINQSLNMKVNIADTTNMLNPYLRKADAIGNIETDPVFNTSIAKGITEMDTAYWNRKTGNSLGNMQYWNGTNWVNLATGLPGQSLIITSEGIPSWSGAAYTTLTTNAVSYITTSSAVVGGNISSDGGAMVTARGLVYGTSANPTLSNTVLTIGSGVGDFSGTLIELTPNTTYYVRAYATNVAGTNYGNEVIFQTLPVEVPTLITIDASGITQTMVTSGGTISNDGGATINERGIVYGTTTNPTTSNTKITSESGTGSFSIDITELTPNTTYYIRAYATNSAGTAYGNEVIIQTLLVEVPTLITNDASAITQTTVTSGGTISNDGGATINERGIVYGTTTNPTTSNTKITSESETGSFSIDITELTPNTTYYIRAYATNSAGTAYGNEVIFQTLPFTSIPSLTTNELTNITNTTAIGGGSITNDGGSNITVKGICWGTSPNPTTLDSKTIDGTGTTTFNSFITGLSTFVTYYVRAYATNSTGTGYGNQQTFTTSSTSNTLPLVTSTSVTGLTTIQAIFNAEVNSQGGGTATERGAVWNNSGNPTVNSNRVSSGSGMGVYTTTISGLSGGSNYYVRAYAINNFGISYGAEIPFITLIGLATLTTNNVITQSTTASSGGNITDNGGSPVTARGVVWNTTGTPTISDNKTTDGSGTGSFVSTISSLNTSTTYYVRAYATNSTGTAYGNQQTSTSQPVTDIDGNTYNTVQIGTQVWMSENLKTSRYRNGGSIPYVLSNSAWRTLTAGAWSYYNHDGSNNAIYGKLYNWYSTLGDTLCPVGWHVPSDTEWTTLTDYLGGESVAGGKMKSIGITNWHNPNTGASNESVFSALPGGCRDSYGSFVYNTTNAYFWSTNEGNNNYALNRVLSSGDSFVTRGNIYIGFSAIKSVGASVRCLKD